MHRVFYLLGFLIHLRRSLSLICLICPRLSSSSFCSSSFSSFQGHQFWVIKWEIRVLPIRGLWVRVRGGRFIKLFSFLIFWFFSSIESLPCLSGKKLIIIYNVLYKLNMKDWGY